MKDSFKRASAAHVAAVTRFHHLTGELVKAEAHVVTLRQQVESASQAMNLAASAARATLTTNEVA